MAFMKQHAGEMDEDVIRQHVELYVNKYSVDTFDCGFLFYCLGGSINLIRL